VLSKKKLNLHKKKKNAKLLVLFRSPRIFTISTTGVTRVDRSTAGEAEAVPLSAWRAEAIAFSRILQIRYFIPHPRLRGAFNRWRRSVRIRRDPGCRLLSRHIRLASASGIGGGGVSSGRSGSGGLPCAAARVCGSTIVTVRGICCAEVEPAELNLLASTRLEEGEEWRSNGWALVRSAVDRVW
jgi:hypothetical protein